MALPSIRWRSIRAASPSGIGYEWWHITQQRHLGLARYRSTWNDPGVVSNVSWSQRPGAPHPVTVVPSSAQYLIPQLSNGLPESRLAAAIESGWPWLALTGGFTCTDPREYKERDIRQFGSVVLTRSPEPDYLPGDKEPSDVLPLRPIPLGFAANAACHAATIWSVHGLWIALRRRSRRHAGQCSGCGHPTLESPVCPECGRRSVEAAPGNSK